VLVLTNGWVPIQVPKKTKPEPPSRFNKLANWATCQTTGHTTSFLPVIDLLILACKKPVNAQERKKERKSLLGLRLLVGTYKIWSQLT